MRIRHVSIQGFRGIKRLEWPIASDLVCLIGPGDTCKSTILDAIELALSERFSVSLVDSDFFGGVVSSDSSIQIDVTVTNLPQSLTVDQKFGLWLRGVKKDGTIRDEPIDDDDEALTVRFRADSSLEPSWTLFKEAKEGEERTIAARDRAQLAIFRVDNEHVAHLRWARGSALTKLESDADPARLIAKAHRAAREAVFEHEDESISQVAESAGAAIKALAAAPMENPRAGMEVTSRAWTTNLTLHDGEIPITRAGLGTRALASAALQLKALAANSTVLLDEIELGLEPHRLRHLLQTLKSRQTNAGGQTFMTTHSPQVVDFLQPADLHVVRRDEEKVLVRQVPQELDERSFDWPRKTLTQCPSALLARRVVIGEGTTEAGILSKFMDEWGSKSSYPPALAGAAVRVVNDGGTKAPVDAKFFAELGFETLLFADNDLTGNAKTQFDNNVEKAREAGAEIVRCDEGKCIEQQIFDAVPLRQLQQLLDLALELYKKSPSAFQDRINGEIGDGKRLDIRSVLSWSDELAKPMETIRTELAVLARDDGWFKTLPGSYKLGQVLVDCWEQCENTRLHLMIEKVRQFVLAPLDGVGRTPDEQ